MKNTYKSYRCNENSPLKYFFIVFVNGWGVYTSQPFPSFPAAVHYFLNCDAKMHYPKMKFQIQHDNCSPGAWMENIPNHKKKYGKSITVNFLQVHTSQIKEPIWDIFPLENIKELMK